MHQMLHHRGHALDLHLRTKRQCLVVAAGGVAHGLITGRTDRQVSAQVHKALQQFVQRWKANYLDAVGMALVGPVAAVPGQEEKGAQVHG